MKAMLVRELIRRLTECGDVDSALTAGRMDPCRAVAALKSSRGRQELAARRALARLQGRLLAQRYSGMAVTQLCRLLDDSQKPEVRLKGALSVLLIAGLPRKKCRRVPSIDRPSEEELLPPMDTAEALELLDAVADALARRRQLAAMGDLPASPPSRELNSAGGPTTMEPSAGGPG